MDITVTLSPVEADTLTLLFPGSNPVAAIHALLQPAIARAGEQRLQRLATEYRALSADDQLEATGVLVAWRDKKYPPVAPPVDPPVTPGQGR